MVYPDAGFAVIRNTTVYAFISNGGYSKYPKESDVIIGTHTHNDLLSFELNINGQDLIVDPGTYLYTSSPSFRNEFRSTRKHNTIEVDGEEQNEFINPFVVKRNVYVPHGHVNALELFNVVGNYLGQRQAAPFDAEQHQPLRAVVALDYLVRYPCERANDRRLIHKHRF